MDRIEQGLTAFRATSGEVAWTSYLALLAEGTGACGRIAEGLLAVEEALGVMEKSGERFYEVELYRLKGDLLLRRVSETVSPAVTTQEAEGWFLRALDMARQRQEKLSELQVILSLARLWQQQGQRQAARALLQESYSRFTEGWHIPILQEAYTLLKALEA